VLDWQRLCKLADYDRSWVAAPLPEEEPPVPAPADRQDTTLAGDPASFV
jgi:hypothetical protein